MIEDRTIICIASDWDYNPTCKHHIMKILSRRNRVVWVNYRGTRRPRINIKDLAAMVHILCRTAHGVRRVSDSFSQITPLVLPGANGSIGTALNRRMLEVQIARALKNKFHNDQQHLQVWSFAPDVPYLIHRFHEECFVYYCTDEHQLFAGNNAKRIARLERKQVENADVVIATSQPLLETKRRIRPDVYLMRHGVDFNHFASARQERLPVPHDINNVPKPIFGFFGLLHDWIDINLIARVAKLRPDYSFVLIGDTRVDVTALKAVPNVHLLGRKPHRELPNYCAHFDAGLMPFSQNAMAPHINPIKMYEYLAAGLPIISTPLPEAQRFAGPVIIADNSTKFAECCDKVLAGDHPWRGADIARFVENESWENKVEQLSDLITTATARKENKTAATMAVPTPQRLTPTILKEGSKTTLDQPSPGEVGLQHEEQLPSEMVR